MAEGWHEVLSGRLKRSLEAAILRALPRQPWFRGKARQIQSATLAEAVPIEKGGNSHGAMLLFIRAEYAEGEPDVYLMPIACAWGEQAEQITLAQPQALLALVNNRETHEAGVLYDALADAAGAKMLFEFITGRRRVQRGQGESLSGRCCMRRRKSPADRLPIWLTPRRALRANRAIAR